MVWLAFAWAHGAAGLQGARFSTQPQQLEFTMAKRRKAPCTSERKTAEWGRSRATAHGLTALQRNPYLFCGGRRCGGGVGWGLKAIELVCVNVVVCIPVHARIRTRPAVLGHAREQGKSFGFALSAACRVLARGGVHPADVGAVAQRACGSTPPPMASVRCCSPSPLVQGSPGPPTRRLRASGSPLWPGPPTLTFSLVSGSSQPGPPARPGWEAAVKTIISQNVLRFVLWFFSGCRGQPLQRLFYIERLRETRGKKI